MKSFVPTPTTMGLAPVRTFQELRSAMESELRRARRYERPLAMVTLALDTAPLGLREREGAPTEPRNGGGASRRGRSSRDEEVLVDSQLGFLLLAALLRDSVRETDILGYAAELHRFIGCLPECSAEAARQAVDRVERLLRERSRWRLRVGVAAFPTDALTLPDLIRVADHDLVAGRAARMGMLREASAS